MSRLATARLHAVVGSSHRLRDEYLATLLAEWTGSLHRVTEPDDLPAIAVDLDTPSLFGDPTLWVIRADERYLGRHRDRLVAMAGAPRGNGGGGAGAAGIGGPGCPGQGAAGERWPSSCGGA